MRSYGMSAGTAFQIIDDVLDVTGDQATVGKTLGKDASLGKLTLPTIHCLTNADAATASALRAAFTGESPCRRDHLKQWLNEIGSIEYAISVARECVAEALRHLELLPPGDAKTSLTAMAEFIIDRRF